MDMAYVLYSYLEDLEMKEYEEFVDRYPSFWTENQRMLKRVLYGYLGCEVTDDYRSSHEPS
ncbi:hypothetical protein Slin15195_G111490 [Septoria linicola]|uniref:Uncharacterized protein n=1 Tax=Septoria linicola TaxID=215465 RepID=A0A9Q9AZ86_9PEZI|nr:hypothetical protein Slin14017_G109840 [Septoria linicola]USW57830.1 hypothetical protein Slin15195_G111490 [Septoria linicola]